MRSTNRVLLLSIIYPLSGWVFLFPIITLLLAARLISPYSLNAVGNIVKPKVDKLLESFPLFFESNQGQTDSKVKFLSRSNDYSLSLTETGATLSLKNGTLSMELVGANSTPKVVGQEKLEGKVNYFIGNNSKNWKTDIATYAKVHYSSVYDGIDLVYYGNQGQLEYDFIVNPGTDPSEIIMSFSGINNLIISEKGHLVLGLNDEDLVINKPALYQIINGVRQEVDGEYIINEDKTVGFNVGTYNSDYKLVIDPIIAYSTYLGGGSFDQGRGIALDNMGNIYVTGYTMSLNFPITQGAFQTTHANTSNNDAFVAKFSSDGSTLIYSTFIGGAGGSGGGTGADLSRAITVDQGGNAYIAGTTNSSDFPTFNAIQPTFVPDTGPKAFVTKLNSTGTQLIYSTFLGFSSSDAYDIVLDNANSVYITGITFNLPTTPDAFQIAPKAGDAFVTKISSDGMELEYSTYLGGSGGEIGYGIDLGPTGLVYIVGATQSSDFPVSTSALQQSNAGSSDGFITVLEIGNPQLVYSTYIGGGGNDEVEGGIKVDDDGNMYILGQTESTNFPTTAGSFQPTYGGGGRDAFVTKFSFGGSLIYSTYLGGNDTDIGRKITVDQEGQVFLTGQSSSSNFPLSHAVQNVYRGNTDAVVVKINESGSELTFSTFLGGSLADSAYDIELDGSDVLYIVGDTSSSNYPITSGAFQTSLAGQTDTFVTKIILANQPPTVSINGPYIVNEGSTIQVSAMGNDPENGLLTYSWDLDDNGSFESSGQSVTFSAAGLDGPDTKSIAVQVTDDGNLTSSDTATVNVSNVSPIVDVITAPIEPEAVNISISTGASFTDAGTLDTHTAVWDWGDSTTSPGTITETYGSGTVTGTHIYTTAGVYTLTLTVLDDDTGFGSNQFKYIVIYNPQGGFVTGAGRFDARIRSIVENPDASGMTNFGVNAKYTNGILVGSTRLNFRDGQYVFEFDSTTYDWLVVNNGQAALHGSGTINGNGTYSFELTALDSLPDNFRLQIKDLNNQIVYDNGPSPVTNGNIEVHN